MQASSSFHLQLVEAALAHPEGFHEIHVFGTYLGSMLLADGEHLRAGVSCSQSNTGSDRVCW